MIETFFLVTGVVVWTFIAITMWPLIPLIPMFVVGIIFKHAVNIFEDRTLPDDSEKAQEVLKIRKAQGSWLWKIGHSMTWMKYKNVALAESYMDFMERYYYRYIPFPL